jgi:hypothetical protein
MQISEIRSVVARADRGNPVQQGIAGMIWFLPRGSMGKPGKLLVTRVMPDHRRRCQPICDASLLANSKTSTKIDQKPVLI